MTNYWGDTDLTVFEQLVKDNPHKSEEALFAELKDLDLIDDATPEDFLDLVRERIRELQGKLPQPMPTPSTAPKKTPYSDRMRRFVRGQAKRKVSFETLMEGALALNEEMGRESQNGGTPFSIAHLREVVHEGYYKKLYPPVVGDAVYTDTGNAQYFAKMYEKQLRFDHTRRIWYVFNGHHWHEDREGRVDQMGLAARG